MAAYLPTSDIIMTVPAFMRGRPILAGAQPANEDLGWSGMAGQHSRLYAQRVSTVCSMGGPESDTIPIWVPAASTPVLPKVAFNHPAVHHSGADLVSWTLYVDGEYVEAYHDVGGATPTAPITIGARAVQSVATVLLSTGVDLTWQIWLKATTDGVWAKVYRMFLTETALTVGQLP